MINVLIPCYSRQEQLNAILPMWLKQRGVEYSVIVGAGPDVVVPEHERVKVVRYSKYPITGLASLMNPLIDAADGDILCFVHGDMQAKTTGVLSAMLDRLTDRAMVTCGYINSDGEYCSGAWTHILMADKTLVVQAGKWDPAYDGGIGWEDADFLTRMANLGCFYEQVKLDKPPVHLPHVSCHKLDGAMDRYMRNKRIYNKRWGKGILGAHEAKMLNGKPVLP